MSSVNARTITAAALSRSFEPSTDVEQLRTRLSIVDADDPALLRLKAILWEQSDDQGPNDNQESRNDQTVVLSTTRGDVYEGITLTLTKDLSEHSVCAFQYDPQAQDEEGRVVMTVPEGVWAGEMDSRDMWGELIEAVRTQIHQLHTKTEGAKMTAHGALSEDRASVIAMTLTHWHPLIDNPRSSIASESDPVIKTMTSALDCMLAIWPDEPHFDVDPSLRDATWTDLTGLVPYQYYNQKDRTLPAYKLSPSAASVCHTADGETVVLVRSKGITHEPRTEPLKDVWRVVTKDQGGTSVDQTEEVPAHLTQLGERMKSAVAQVLKL